MNYDNSTPKHSIFISYVHEDFQQVNGFIGMRNFDNDFDFVNRKLDYEIQGKEESIANQIRENYIKKSVVTVVIIGKDTHNSEWVEKEVKMTLRQKHGLLAILLKDTQSHTSDGKYYLPATLNDAINRKYAKFIAWDPNDFKSEIHAAFVYDFEFIVVHNSVFSVVPRDQKKSRCKRLGKAGRGDSPCRLLLRLLVQCCSFFCKFV